MWVEGVGFTGAWSLNALGSAMASFSRGKKRSSGNRSIVSYKIFKALCSLYSALVVGAVFHSDHHCSGRMQAGRGDMRRNLQHGEWFSMGTSFPGEAAAAGKQENPQVIFQLKIRMIYLLFFKSFFYLIAEKLWDLFMPRVSKWKWSIPT